MKDDDFKLLGLFCFITDGLMDGRTFVIVELLSRLKTGIEYDYIM